MLSHGFDQVSVWKATALAVAGLVVANAANAQTFSKDIAPLVFAPGVSAHRTNGPGPSPLTSYDEVRRRATKIAKVTASRFMPPWKVEPGIGHLVGQRLVTHTESATREQWAE